MKYWSELELNTSTMKHVINREILFLNCGLKFLRFIIGNKLYFLNIVTLQLNFTLITTFIISLTNLSMHMWNNLLNFLPHFHCLQ